MGNLSIDKITRILNQPKREVALKLHCKMTKEKNGVKTDFNNVFTFGDNSYLKLEHSTFITLEKIDDTGWSPDKSIMITQRNLFQVQRAFKLMISVVKDKGLFATRKVPTEDGSGHKLELFIYTEDVKDNTVAVKLLGDDIARLAMQPIVYYDQYENTHEGVRIMLNKKVNVIDLSIEEFESLYYTLVSVDFFVYGQMMVNYYMTHIKDKPIEVANANTNFKPVKKPVSFDTVTEETTSTLLKPISDKEIFDI